MPEVRRWKYEAQNGKVQAKNPNDIPSSMTVVPLTSEAELSPDPPDV